LKLLEETREILAQASLLEEKDIKPEHNLEADLGIDSFGAMEVVIGMETKYDLHITDKQWKLFGTVQDIMDYISQNTADKSAEDTV